MNLVPNWKQKYKSLAVIFPVLAVILINSLQTALDQQLIKPEYYPLVIFLTGFIGRIIKQSNLGDTDNANL